MFQIFVCIFISALGLATGKPDGIGGGHGSGGLIGGGGGGHGHGQGYDERPDPFHFQYGVHDDKSYTSEEGLELLVDICYCFIILKNIKLYFILNMQSRYSKFGFKNLYLHLYKQVNNYGLIQEC